MAKIGDIKIDDFFCATVQGIESPLPFLFVCYSKSQGTVMVMIWRTMYVPAATNFFFVQEGFRICTQTSKQTGKALVVLLGADTQNRTEMGREETRL